MIRLHQYPAAWGMTSLSPFCVKVENYLRMRGLPYEIVTETNPRRGPKGKMPFIEDEGHIVADSAFILRYLAAKHGEGPDEALTAIERASAVAHTRLVEDNLYWAMLYSRWGDDAGWNAIQRDFGPLFPLGLGKIALMVIRRQMLAQGRAQGMLRHCATEIYRIADENLESLAHYLAGPRKHSSHDASFHAFLSTIARAPFASPLRDSLSLRPGLVAYLNDSENKMLSPGTPESSRGASTTLPS